MCLGFTTIIVVSLALLIAPADAHAQHMANGAQSSGTAVPAGGGSDSGSASSTSGPASTSSGASSSGAASSGRRWSDAAGAAQRAAATNSVGAHAPTRDAHVPIAVPQFSRPRNGAPIIGYAIPRPAGAPTTGGLTFIPAGYANVSPYGYYGYSGIAGAALLGFYDPFDPFAYAPFSPAFFPIGGGGGGYTSTSSNDENEGALRLKVKPDKAKIYVDGGLVGSVYDYAGLFHKLHLEAGVHRVELRAAGYETLTLNVRIERGQTMTYKGTLEKVVR
jgi:PEGA domain-containing protein